MTPVYTPEEIDTILADLSKKVAIFDFRGKSADEQAALLVRLEETIAQKRLEKGVSADCKLTFVGGSGKTDDAAALHQAFEMGKTLEVVATGGSRYSVMGAIANGAKLAIGVTCDAVLPFETPDDRYDILVIADGAGPEGIKNRLKIARRIAPNEMAMFGGIGTAEEFITGIPVRDHMAMLAPFWTPMMTTFKKMYAYGYMDQATLDKVKPVAETGTPIDPLSHETSLHSDAALFQSEAKRIASIAQAALERRSVGHAHVVGDHTPLDKMIINNNFFILAPGPLEAMRQAVTIMVEKRLDGKKIDSERADYPFNGVLEKPIVLLNIDGFYDGFMEQWKHFAREKYFASGESLAHMVVEVKLPSHATAKTINQAIADKVPNTIGPSIVESSLTRYSPVRAVG